MTRIALLYGDTGGGHRSAAQSIDKGLHIVYGDAVQTELVNALNYAPSAFRPLTEGYPIWVNYARTLYALGFHASNKRRRVVALRNVLEPIGEKAAAEMLHDHPADVYVSCHPIFNHAVPFAIAAARMRSRYVHVVTDLVSGHVLHYAPEVDHCIVPTDEAREEAIRNFVRIDKISVAGQPVPPDFRARMGTRDALRRQLGLQDDKLTVLLMGGGDGMGRLEVTARELALSGLPIQMLVVCGRNRTVRENLEFVNPRVPYMKIFGFVDNVPELMGASDVIITKAGPGTICEAFIAGLPIVLYDAVPGQEEGNVRYVVDKGAGAWCPTPAAVLKQLRTWITMPGDLAAARRASALLARPDSAVEIARILGRFFPAPDATNNS
jgi:1,2-diacylglycerol 3-beta-galactosyltransferase